MAKIKTVKKYDYKTGEFKKVDEQDVVIKIVAASGVVLMVTMPDLAFAAGTDQTFSNLHGAIMNAFDRGIVLVIIFAGASWGLGHRTKAIEILIGVCCGYILARHAVDIRDFLKGI